MAAYAAALLVLAAPASAGGDWLLDASPAASALTPWASGALSGVTLSNGLVSRSFVTSASGAPAWGTWDLTSHLDGAPASLLRAFAPEALLSCAGGCARRAPAPPPGAFALVAAGAVATGGDCAMVGHGDGTSLAACEASCWAAACNAVNFKTAGAPPDCVLRLCADPAAPALSPEADYDVYATLAPVPAAAAAVGGLAAAPALGRSVAAGAYLNRTGLDAPGALVPDPAAAALPFVNFSSGPLLAPFAWTPGARGSDASLAWPPRGLRVEANFGAPGAAWAVRIVYEIFDGVPLLSKRVEVTGAAAAAPPALDAVRAEELALNYGFGPLASMAYAGAASDVPGGSPVFSGTGRLTPISDFQYGTTVAWTNDCLTRGCDAGSTQPRLTAADDAGINVTLAPGTVWTSMRLYLLLHDDGPEQGVAMPLYPSSETYWGCTLGPCSPGSGTPFEGAFSERRGLALRRFLLTVAPHVAENPLQYHLVASDSASVRAACDQMAAVGWEMLVQSYGSGFNLESTDAAYIARVKSDVTYCRARGVEVGGYDLIAWTRDPGRGWAALDASGGDSGNGCFASGWADFFTGAALAFANATGVSVYETDGPYAGYGCSSTAHTHHAGAGDSVQKQTRIMAATYTAFRNAGFHVNAPDSYMIHGASKMGIGYNEGISRLPRTESVVLYRQVAYDATYYTLPSAAWSFLPLTGNAGSEYEPLSEHLAEFEQALTTHLGFGVAAFLYQGTTMYDGPAGAALLSRWAAWFKSYRSLLSTGDVIHVRRPDGQGLDAVLHARAGASVPALLLIYNPTDAPLSETLDVGLYYAGLRGATAANFTFEPWPGAAAAPQTVPLDWRGRAAVAVTVPPRAMTWATVGAA
jgi:hypothetical protein